MNVVTILLGFLIASVYGALFHLLRDGSGRRLFLYLVLAWAGFAAGHFVGDWFGWRLLPIGPLDFGAATVGSVLFLALSFINIRRAKKEDDGV